MHLNLDAIAFAAGCAGYGLLVAGVSCFDWRIGLIVAGTLLLAWSALAARAVARNAAMNHPDKQRD